MKNRASEYHLLCFLLTLVLFTSCQKKKSASETILPRKNYDVVKMANGALVQADVLSRESSNNALTTAPIPSAYSLKLIVDVAIPSPATTMEDLCMATPELATALPSLKEMLPQVSGKVSSKGEKKDTLFYTTLFENKIKVLERQLSHLGQLPSRESLYDCQTILSLTNQATKNRILLIQAIMNVNADGSDGDRNIPLEKLSATYQPQTNYRWPKASSRPNPNIPELQQELSQIEKSLSDEKITPEQKEKLQQQIFSIQATLQELERWSFLIGSADPFIVLPKFMLDKKNEGASIGDYAVVLYQGTLYPAIVGDIGPSSKIGEASLRICRAIDPRSSAEHRPLSSPHVSYFIFPGSAELPFKAPDYAHWSERCHELWKNIGGSEQILWHPWEKLEQPWPDPCSQEQVQLKLKVEVEAAKNISTQ
ncbi:MAG: glycoside hydrolase family 75 protein [Chthoniobacterales bacterium]